MRIICVSLVVLAFAVASQGRQCWHEGKYYDPGEKWVDSSCTWRCTCYQGGRLRCKSLCYRLFTKTCRHDEITEYRKVNVLGSKCQCDKPHCVKKPTATEKPEGCEHNGKKYDVGDTFIDSCTWRCKCNPETRISCSSVCPRWTVRCSRNKVKRIKKIPVPGSNCVCEKPTCEPKPKKQCYYRSNGGRGKYYNAGESWTDPTCTWRCICTKTGRYQCESLCSKAILRCASHQIKQIKQVAVPGSSTCKCNKAVCVDDSSRVCTQDGKRYYYDQTFINDACTKRCSCRRFGRLSCSELCPDFYANYNCGPNRIKKEKQVAIAGSNCHCKRPHCVDKPKVKCYYHANGKYYDADETWVDSTCTWRCTCDGNTRRYKCSSLCSSNTVRCGRHQIKKRIQEDVPGSSTCKCTKNVCVDKPKPKNVRCYYHPQSKYYNAGESWIHSCKWRCSCDNSGRYKCDALCLSHSVTCASNQIKQIKQIDVPGSSCKCKKPVCIDRQQGSCRIGGKVYSIGQSFVDPACTRKCTCNRGGRASCQRLCSPTYKRCGSHETTKYKKVAVLGSRCFCNEAVCVDNNVYCNFRGERFKVGESIVDRSCRWSCDCNAGGIYNCVSACVYISKRCSPWQVKLERYVPVKNSKTCRCKVPYCSDRR